MYTLLVLLYVMKANSIMIPMWCFVLTWVLTVVKFICNLIIETYKFYEGRKLK